MFQALFHVPSFVNWLIDDKKHHTACEKMSKYYILFSSFEYAMCLLSHFYHCSVFYEIT